MTNMEVALDATLTEDFESSLKPTLRVIGLETPTREGDMTWNATKSFSKTVTPRNRSPYTVKYGAMAQIAYGMTDSELMNDPAALSLDNVKTGRVQWPFMTEDSVKAGKPLAHQGGIMPYARIERTVNLHCPRCKMTHSPMAEWLFRKKVQERSNKCDCGSMTHKGEVIQPPMRDGMTAAVTAAMESDQQFRWPTFLGLFPRGQEPTTSEDLGVQPMDDREIEVVLRLEPQGLTAVTMRALRAMYGGPDGWAEPIPHLSGVFGVGHPVEAGWADDKTIGRNDDREGFQGFSGKPFYKPAPRPSYGRKKNKNFLRTV